MEEIGQKTLTPRQIQVLKVLIEEYIETAEPVGSETLERRYNLGVSPATVRNEMSTLTTLGYLRQLHTSAGRIPTSRALHFYVDQIMEEKQLSVAEEAQARGRVLEVRTDFDRLMSEVTRSLAQTTRSLAFGALDEENRVWYSGYANLLQIPEFYNIDVTSHVLSLLDEVERLHQLLERLSSDPMGVLFGEDLGWKYFEPIGIIGRRFQAGGRSVSLGVIGAARCPYWQIIPKIRYFGNLIEEVTK